MKRRAFLMLLGTVGAAWPAAIEAQQTTRLPTIGFLGAATPSAWNQRVAAFSERLRELGWIDGSTVKIEFRWGEDAHFAEIAAEFVWLKVDVIVTAGTAAVLQVEQATSEIPVVFAAAGAPEGTGIVASLARPGGNVTGLSLQQTDTAAKRLELLREIVPGIRRLAILGNGGTPVSVLEMNEVAAVARTLGLDADMYDVRGANDIPTAMDKLRDVSDALYLAGDPLMLTNRDRIANSAFSARLPTISGDREFVDRAALMSYGANFSHLFRRAAQIVDKILRGARPADIPVEQPTKFDLIINLNTARAIGLTVPAALLARADEVIE